MNDIHQKVDETATEATGTAKQMASDAVDRTKAYAQDAVKAAGEKLDRVKSQWDVVTDSLTKAIHDDPVRSVAVTALVSAGLTALVLTLLRNDDRRF